MADHDDLLARNALFYAAFAQGDIDSMSELWAKDENISCVHPGWTALVGRKAVIASWRAILANAESSNILFRDPYAIVSGSEGLVLCIEAINEHLLQASNHFRLIDGAWRLVHHQSSPISAAQAPAVPPGTSLN